MMAPKRYLFDTSVLVAGSIKYHEFYRVASSWLDASKRQQLLGIIAAQSVAEFYSVITRLPLEPKISPLMARQLIENNLYSMEVVSLELSDYQRAVYRLSNLGLVGGVVFDALLAELALRSGIDGLLTFNAKDFRRLGTDVAELVIVPDVFLPES